MRKAILSLALFLVSAGNARCQPISAEMRAQDARLEKRVTLSEPRIYLGELLNKLSKQSGVAVSAQDRDTASGVPLAVFVTDLPLCDVLNSLWSLVSYQDAEWLWERTGEPGRSRYVLIETAEAKRLPDQVNAAIWKAFDALAEVMLDVAEMTPEQRKTQVDRITKAHKAEDKRYAESWIESGSMWEMLRLFRQALPKETRARVLRGGSVRVRPDQLPEPVRDAVLRIAERNKMMITRTEGGIPMPLPPPQYVTFRGGASGTVGSFAPNLWIGFDQGGIQFADSQFGDGLFHRNLCLMIRDLWMLPGDAKDDAREALKPEAGDGPAPWESGPVTNSARRAFPKRLWQASRAVPTNCIALLPDEVRDPGVPSGVTLKAYLDRQRENWSLLHKWRGGVLLLGSARRFLEMGGDVPYFHVRELRDRRKRNGGYLTLDNIADLFALLNDAQILRLAPEMPELGQWLPSRLLLALIQRNPALCSSSGLAASPEVLAALRSVPRLSGALHEGVRFVRLREEKPTAPGGSRHVVWMEWQGPDGKWQNSGGTGPPPRP